MVPLNWKLKLPSVHFGSSWELEFHEETGLQPTMRARRNVHDARINEAHLNTPMCNDDHKITTVT